jgi:hypothetical protein
MGPLLALPLSAAQQKFPEVTARKGPIQLTLRLYKTKLQRHKTVRDYRDSQYWLDGANGRHPLNEKITPEEWAKDPKHITWLPEPIWFQIEIKNIGKKPLNINDAVLFYGNDKGFADALRRNTEERRGLYVAVKDEKGRMVKGFFPQHLWHGCPENRRGLYNLRAFPPDEDEPNDNQKLKNSSSSYSRGLAPSQSITTRTWAFRGYCKNDHPNPLTPPEGFAELFNFNKEFETTILKPGRYRVYAVYDYEPRPKEEKIFREFHLMPSRHDIEDIELKTPTITIEIEP